MNDAISFLNDVYLKSELYLYLGLHYTAMQHNPIHTKDRRNMSQLQAVWLKTDSAVLVAGRNRSSIKSSISVCQLLNTIGSSVTEQHLFKVIKKRMLNLLKQGATPFILDIASHSQAVTPHAAMLNRMALKLDTQQPTIAAELRLLAMLG